MENFYIKSKNLFVTVSQAEANLKGEIQKLLCKKEKHLRGGIISEEFHQNQGTHYHILLKYDVYKKITSHLYFDYLLGKQTNIQKVKNINAVESYCKKDGNYIVFGDFEKRDHQIVKLSTADIEEIVYKEIFAGNHPSRLLNHPLLEIRVYISKHMSTLSKAFATFINFRNNEDQSSKKGIKSSDINKIKELFQDDSAVVTILDYIQGAQQLQYCRPFKSLNLHIYSNLPNVGKSTLLGVLRQLFPTYVYPPTQWFKEYKDTVYSMIIWDEFSLVGWDIQFLNLFFEGSAVDLPVKFSIETKTDNPLIIMCSNKSLKHHFLRKFSCKCFCTKKREDQPEICYKEDGRCNVDDYTRVQYRTFKARVKEVEIVTGNSLFSLVDRLKILLK